MPCEVCSLVHGDNTVKLCFYCDVCTAYICCARCKNDLINRAKAAAIKLANKAKEAFIQKKKNEKTKTTNRRNK